MTDTDELTRRLEAVERAVTDGTVDADPSASRTADTAAQDDELAERLDEVERRLDDLEAGLQAVRGYVGSVRAVNDDVERRANVAVAKAEAVEARLESATGDEAVVSEAATHRPIAGVDDPGDGATADGRRVADPDEDPEPSLARRLRDAL